LARDGRRIIIISHQETGREKEWTLLRRETGKIGLEREMIDWRLVCVMVVFWICIGF
jgi:hypothetical protein